MSERKQAWLYTYNSQEVHKNFYSHLIAIKPVFACIYPWGFPVNIFWLATIIITDCKLFYTVQGSIKVNILVIYCSYQLSQTHCSVWFHCHNNTVRRLHTLLITITSCCFLQRTFYIKYKPCKYRYTMFL